MMGSGGEPRARTMAPGSAANKVETSSCLLVLAHPRLDRSRVNAALAAEASLIPGVEILDLYERYPDYQIDVAAEQRRMLSHNVICLQFPFLWYSIPSLLKEWFDLVWLHGFAYGGSSSQLEGKTLFCATTTGGDSASYEIGGRNGHTMDEFLRPLERTAALCRMRWAEPWVLHDAPRQLDELLTQARAQYRDQISAMIRRSPLT